MTTDDDALTSLVRYNPTYTDADGPTVREIDDRFDQLGDAGPLARLWATRDHDIFAGTEDILAQIILMFRPSHPTWNDGANIIDNLMRIAAAAETVADIYRRYQAQEWPHITTVVCDFAVPGIDDHHPAQYAYQAPDGAVRPVCAPCGAYLAGHPWHLPVTPLEAIQGAPSPAASPQWRTASLSEKPE